MPVPDLELHTQRVAPKNCGGYDDFVQALQQGVARLKQDKGAHRRAIAMVGKGYKNLVKQAMKIADGPIFATVNGIKPSYMTMIRIIGTLRDQALSTRPYPIRGMVKYLERFLLTQADMSGMRAMHPGPAYEYAWEVLSGKRQLDPKDAKNAFCAQPGIPSTEKIKYINGLEQKLLVIKSLGIRMDALGLQAFFRLVMDFKLLIIAHPFKAIKRNLRTPGHFAWQLLKAWKKARKDLNSYILNLEPSHPYYKATIEGLKLYRRIAKAGGFVRIPFSRTLKRGMQGRDVIAVKKRLAQESYKVGELTPLFDDTLVAAVKHYQRTHQYKPTGIVDRRVARSMNVSVKRRIRAIKLSLQRWRESQLNAHDPFYVRVNIPEFMMEVWDHGKLAMKHEVIVGNNNWARDPIGMVEGRLNRTKIFSCKIKKIVLNPRWHVPDRIKKLEIYKKNVFDQPDYFVKNNFKVKLNPDGTEMIFQEAGDNNALGRVKFVFPNPYSIFMHDTDEKELFKKQIRAFSHGCIRLHKPLEVAFYMLHRLKGMTKAEFDKILAQEDPTVEHLDPPVPIHIDYNTVSVDQDGKMMFFIDVYQYDRDFYHGKIPYTEKELELLLKKIKKLD